jgi:S-ribosylhomocysteine lyase
MQKVESFELDHTKVKAPFVRKCCVQQGEKGDKITKFDIRFTQPNVSEMQSEGIHTLEHLMATHLREKADYIIDVSPMGCRTGFYMTCWGEIDVNEIIDALNKSLNKVLDTTEIPAENEVQCGNYRLHSLKRAKEYAKKVLDEGIKDKFLIE